MSSCTLCIYETSGNTAPLCFIKYSALMKSHGSFMSKPSFPVVKNGSTFVPAIVFVSNIIRVFAISRLAFCTYTSGKLCVRILRYENPKSIFLEKHFDLLS